MAASKFRIDNPDQLIYTNELLTITVLGGIKLEGLDRLRTTLKVELNGSSRPAVRHNLDLYNDTQSEKFMRKVAERHEIGTSVIAASLNELTEQLEHYRLEKLKAEADNQKVKAKQLTETERKAARAFLEKPELLTRTNELIGKSGMIGEELNRLLMYLIFTSRKREQPLHIVSLGSSGTGKTHLQEKVGELIPEEDRLEITVLSENAFYYFGQRELQHKLILIEDLDGADSALYPLRELQSKKRISKTVAHKNTKGETRTVHLIVEGPVSVAGCTTKEKIYEDNANHYALLKNKTKLGISFYIYQGMTTGEMESLTIHDVDVEEGTVIIRASKRLNSRILQLKNNQRLFLENYLNSDRPQLLKTETDQLFITKLGTNEKGESFHYLLESQRELFQERTLNPKTVRQSVITNWFRQGLGIKEVQIMAGHRFPSTTEGYRPTDLGQLSDAIGRFHPLG